MCGVSVAMEDIEADCGPLVYYPGSHRLTFASPSEVGIDVDPGRQAVSHEEYAAHYEPYIEQLIEREGLQPKYGTLTKGQAVVFGREPAAWWLARAHPRPYATQPGHSLPL